MTRFIFTAACVLSMACSSAGFGRAPAPVHAVACVGGVVRSDMELDRYRGCAEISGDLELSNVTSLEPLKEFFVAEDYHQDYAELHPDQPYIACTAVPHVKHVRKTFPELLKK